MDKIQPGKFVEYAYRLFDNATGELLFEAKKDQPDQMVYGASQDVVPALVNAIDGLSVGDRFELELPPAAAFGDYNPHDVLELDSEIFMRDGKIAEEVKAGALLPMMTADGYRVMGRVLEVGKKVKMDFNHPFAGKTVRYEGEIITVRDATEDEIHPTSGCGGCHGGCGSHEGGCGCDEGGCGEGGCCGK